MFSEWPLYFVFYWPYPTPSTVLTQSGVWTRSPEVFDFSYCLDFSVLLLIRTNHSTCLIWLDPFHSFRSSSFIVLWKMTSTFLKRSFYSPTNPHPSVLPCICRMMDLLEGLFTFNVNFKMNWHRTYIMFCFIINTLKNNV